MRRHWLITPAMLLAVGCVACSSTSGAGSDATTAGTPTPVSSPSAGTSSSAPVKGVESIGNSPTPSTSPAASTSTSTPPSTPKGFVGVWDGHGREITITASGRFTLGFRTYVNCTSTKTTGCDRITGNQIIDGGHVTGYVTAVQNDTTVTVTVDSTTVPDAVPEGPFRLGLDTKNDAIAPFVGQLNGTPFCGANAPNDYCGA